jgi:hypothetical protein
MPVNKTFLKFVCRSSTIEYEAFLGQHFLHYSCKSEKVPTSLSHLFRELNGFVYHYTRDDQEGTLHLTKYGVAEARGEWAAVGVKPKKFADTVEQRSVLGLQAKLYKREFVQPGGRDTTAYYRTFQLLADNLSKDHISLFRNNKCAEYLPMFDRSQGQAEGAPPFKIAEWSECNGRRLDHLRLESISPVHLDKKELNRIYSQFSER